jgi:hypothetical protein
MRHERSNTASTVATLLDFRAISIKYLIERYGVWAPWLGQHKCLIEANAGVSMSEPAQGLSVGYALSGTRIKHHKVVAQTMHFDKIKSHMRIIARALLMC